MIDFDLVRRQLARPRLETGLRGVSYVEPPSRAMDNLEGNGARPAQRRAWLAPDRPAIFRPRLTVHEKSHRLLGSGPPLANGTVTNLSWAGGVLPGQWAAVRGTWTIPTVQPAADPGGSTWPGWSSSSWVGLDGVGSNDVLQAGIEQSVNLQGQATYVAWFEWFAPSQPGSPAYINQCDLDNFPVQPGQVVSCTVYYYQGQGIVRFENPLTHQSELWLTLAPPPGASSSGSSAEWILEVPGGYPSAALPAFSDVVFTQASCTSADGQTLGNPLSANAYNILRNGQLRTAANLASGSVLIHSLVPAQQLVG